MRSKDATSNEAMTFGSAKIRTKSSMSDFCIGRSTKRVVSSVWVKVYQCLGFFRSRDSQPMFLQRFSKEFSEPSMFRLQLKLVPDKTQSFFAESQCRPVNFRGVSGPLYSES